MSGNAIWVSFLIGGAIAALSAYSYAKLGARYPSSGGAVTYLIRGFGDNVLSGGFNVFLWIGYVLALALYAHAFAAYALTFLPSGASDVWHDVLAVGIVVAFTGINFLGAQAVGRAETLIVAIKVGILVIFAGIGLFFVEPSRLSVSGWPDGIDILFGTGILFIGYEGFGLVANAAGEMADPKRLLPRALFWSVAIVIGIYITVAVMLAANLSLHEIAASRDYALAEAVKPFLGEVGFTLIAVAALFSTASAINATLFGGASVSYTIARQGQLPAVFSRKVWATSTEGLFITSALVIAFVLGFDLSRIAMMGSASFLLVYAAVNAAHLRVIGETGARRWIVWLSLATCVGMFGVLAYYTADKSPPAMIALVVVLLASFAGEAVYRRITARRLEA